MGFRAQQFVRANEVAEAVALERAKTDRLRAVLLNIQALAERGFPIDCASLATRCRLALANG